MDIRDFEFIPVKVIDRHIFDVPVPYKPFTTEYQAFVDGINAINEYYKSQKTVNPYIMCVLPCPCGKNPKFKFTSRTYGHGEYGTTAALTCTCGRTTTDYEVSGYGGTNDGLHSVVNDWNKFFGIPVFR